MFGTIWHALRNIRLIQAILRNTNSAAGLAGVCSALYLWAQDGAYCLLGGATACVSGTVCTKLNDCEEVGVRFCPAAHIWTDYSQCLPGAASPAPTGSSLPRLGGVNTAGYDFSVVSDTTAYCK